MHNLMLEESRRVKEDLQLAKDKLKSVNKVLENSHVLFVRHLRDQKKECIKRIRER